MKRKAFGGGVEGRGLCVSVGGFRDCCLLGLRNPLQAHKPTVEV